MFFQDSRWQVSRQRGERQGAAIFQHEMNSQQPARDAGGCDRARTNAAVRRTHCEFARQRAAIKPASGDDRTTQQTQLLCLPASPQRRRFPMKNWRDPPASRWHRCTDWRTRSRQSIGSEAPGPLEPFSFSLSSPRNSDVSPCQFCCLPSGSVAYPGRNLAHMAVEHRSGHRTDRSASQRAQHRSENPAQAHAQGKRTTLQENAR